MFFDSLNENYKTPYGAVEKGQIVKFKLILPPVFAQCKPRLVWHFDGQIETEAVLLKGDTTKDGDVTFHYEFTADAIGLCYYHFDLYSEYRKIFRGELGKGYMTTEKGTEFQLTIYKKGFETPDEFKGKVMYQIFPDRFYESHPHPKMPFDDRVYRTDKDGEPYFWPNECGGHLNLDFFGGDLQGIIEKMPYLKSLGVTIIYLNPIFEAHSNHRYNTADYNKIDPVLGDETDFVNLCKVAKENDVKIVLDGVFSHTGSESVYFNKSKFYGEGGAFNDVNSVYRSWYDFSPNYPCGYRSWWGFESLPEVNEDDPAFQNFICGEGGVIEKWLNLGADGFRLDVADELPDDFIEQIRKTVKRCGEEKLLIGEVWEDATNKWSYGARRTYLLGEGLDSVMNYPFRNAVIQFIKYGDAIGAMDSIFDICENYPKPSLDTAMNFLSTHDTERIITTLAGEDAEGRDRYWQSGRLLSDEKYEVGKQLLRLGFAFMFFLPGNPCVYYGDEIAMEGYKDPFNRGYFNWDETDDRLINTIRALSRMREQNPVFKEGRLSIIRAEKDILCLKRSDETGEAVIAINRTRHNIVLDMLDETVTVTPYSFAIRSAIK